MLGNWCALIYLLPVFVKQVNLVVGDDENVQKCHIPFSELSNQNRFHMTTLYGCFFLIEIKYMSI